MKQRSADAAHIGQVVLEVRVELGIPKLLVKINPSEASRVSAKNLGEVLLRKLSAQKGHVAVLHMSRSVPPGELVMSLKLAEMLDVEEEESVELSLAGNAPREADKPACRPAPHAPTAPPLRPATSVPREPREAPKPSCTNGAYLDSGFTKAPAEHRPWGSFSGIAAPRVASDGSTARPGAGAPTAPPLRPATSIPRDREAPKSPCTNSTYLDSGFNKAPSEYRPWSSFSGTPATRAASDGCTGRPGAAPPAPPPPPPPPLRPATNVPRESREAPKSPWANSTYVDSGFSKAPSEHRPWASYSGTSPPRAAPDGSSTRWQMAEELIEEDGVKAGDAAGGKPWNAPSSQKRVVNNGRPVHSHPVPTVAEALEPSPLPSRAASQASSRASSVSSSDGSLELGQRSRKDFTTNIPVVRNGLKKGKEGCSKPSSQASSNVASSTTVSSPRISAEQEMRATDVGGVDAEQQTAAAPPQATAQGGAATIVPTGSLTWENAKANFSRRQSGLLNRRRTLSFGALQAETPKLPPSEPRQPVPSYWRGPTDAGGSGLERSELGSEVTAEIRRWLLAETSGPQCSQVVLDRALTVLANFKLASGCQLEVLGGPLGAIVGGYSDADWLHDEVFQKQPAEALRDAFAHFGFRPRHDGDWSNVAAEEVSLAYRRLCLRGHPSRGGAPRIYLKLQVAMELIRAFAGEAGSLDPHGRTPTSLRSATTPCSRQLSEPSRDDFVLTDATLVRELKLTAHEAEEEAAEVSMEQLEEMNRALDEYILRQMCFKSEIVDEIARLHENCAYAILGVSADATDAEIKKAYRFIAMQCHPDKGGDKEDFQELHNAYEKIMEQRRSLNEATRGKSGSEGKYGDMDADNADLISEERSHEDHQEKSKSKPKAKSSKEPKDAEGMDGEQEEDEAEASEEDEYGEDSSNAALVEKATKAAEEASRYAKTAAEFAHQAAEAAETARRGREQGSRDTLTKSIAHSAIVLTLTVVKAVRVVGYATLDVAAQCRIVAKRYPAAAACSERAVSAMSLGLEALGAALSCAEVTETTAAELQAPTSNLSEEESSVWPAAAAERFVGAAVRASLAAANASNAAMSAAIAAVEGSRDVEKAVEEQTSANENQEAKRRPSHHGEGGQEGVDRADEDGDDDLPDIELPRQPPSPEEVAAASMRRLVAQRNNNHKVLQRLNSEILSHQENVRSFLQHNRALIPSVSEEEKTKVFRLLADYAAEARTELESILLVRMTSDEVLEVLSTLSLLVPFAQPQALAIPVSVKARVLKMAALYDISLTMKILDTEIFQVVQHANVMEGARRRIDEVYRRVKNELLCNVAETS